MSRVLKELGVLFLFVSLAFAYSALDVKGSVTGMVASFSEAHPELAQGSFYVDVQPQEEKAAVPVTGMQTANVRPACGSSEVNGVCRQNNYWFISPCGGQELNGLCESFQTCCKKPATSEVLREGAGAPTRARAPAQPSTASSATPSRPVSTSEVLREGSQRTSSSPPPFCKTDLGGECLTESECSGAGGTVYRGVVKECRNLLPRQICCIIPEKPSGGLSRAQPSAEAQSSVAAKTPCDKIGGVCTFLFGCNKVMGEGYCSGPFDICCEKEKGETYCSDLNGVCTTGNECEGSGGKVYQGKVKECGFAQICCIVSGKEVPTAERLREPSGPGSQRTAAQPSTPSKKVPTPGVLREGEGGRAQALTCSAIGGRCTTIGALFVKRECDSLGGEVYHSPVKECGLFQECCVVPEKEVPTSEVLREGSAKAPTAPAKPSAVTPSKKVPTSEVLREGSQRAPDTRKRCAEDLGGVCQSTGSCPADRKVSEGKCPANLVARTLGIEYDECCERESGKVYCADVGGVCTKNPLYCRKGTVYEGQTVECGRFETCCIPETPPSPGPGARQAGSGAAEEKPSPAAPTPTRGTSATTSEVVRATTFYGCTRYEGALTQKIYCRQKCGADAGEEIFNDPYDTDIIRASGFDYLSDCQVALKKYKDELKTGALFGAGGLIESVSLGFQTLIVDKNTVNEKTYDRTAIVIKFAVSKPEEPEKPTEPAKPAERTYCEELIGRCIDTATDNCREGLELTSPSYSSASQSCVTAGKGDTCCLKFEPRTLCSYEETDYAGDVWTVNYCSEASDCYGDTVVEPDIPKANCEERMGREMKAPARAETPEETGGGTVGGFEGGEFTQASGGASDTCSCEWDPYYNDYVYQGCGEEFDGLSC